MVQPAGQAPSPALLKRQKRQRRITVGSKATSGREVPLPAAAPAPADPWAAAAAQGVALLPPALQALQQRVRARGGAVPREVLDAVWAAYLCPGRAQLWEFAKALLPPPSRWAIEHLHPADVYPDHFPASLPPGLEFLPTLRLPRGVPAAAQPRAAAQLLAEPAAQAGAADAAAESSGWLQDGAEGGSGGSCVACDTLAYCGCSECVSCRDSSPESERMQPGKRIKWRGAIFPTDPVRRNLFGQLDHLEREEAAAAAAAVRVPPRTRSRRQATGAPS